MTRKSVGRVFCNLAEKEKYNFYRVVNKLVYVTLTVRENCAHFHSIFDLSTFLCFKSVSEGTFYAVLLQEMEIISRAESLDYVTAFFSGRRSAWFPLFTARHSRKLQRCQTLRSALLRV